MKSRKRPLVLAIRSLPADLFKQLVRVLGKRLVESTGEEAMETTSIAIFC